LLIAGSLLFTRVSIDTLQSFAGRTESIEIEKYTSFVENLKKIQVNDLYDKPFIWQEKKFIILNFWASWCVPCLSEMNSLNGLKNLLKDNLSVISINIDDDLSDKELIDFINQSDWPFQHISGEKLSFEWGFTISRLPFSLLLVDGKIELVNDAYFDFENKEFVKELLSF
jgi:thiol-disulfide isomerase/thioredoxin